MADDSSLDVASSGTTTPFDTAPSPEAQRAATSTPITRKTAGYTMYSRVEEKLMVLKYEELASETRGHYIGPMPVQTFLDDFLPWNEETPQAFRDAKISAIRLNRLKSVAVATEKESYKKYINAFANWTKGASKAAAKAVGIKPSSFIKSSFTFTDTHSQRDASCGNLGMDITLYGNLRVRRDKPRVMDFHNAESFAELKPTEYCDGFVDPPESAAEEHEEAATEEEVVEESDEDSEADDDGDDDAIGKEEEELYVAHVVGEDNVEVPPEPDEPVESTPLVMTSKYPFENESKVGVKTRGQLAAYNAVTLAVQYRSHVFSTLLCGKYVRLMRWDRSCAIVSRRFDYTTTQGATTLFRFYARLAQLTDAQRGLDPSISIPTKTEGEAAKEVFRPYVSELWNGQTQSYFKEQTPAGILSLLKMTFQEESYIIPAPVYHEGFLSPFCRSTRRCIAYREGYEKAFFFKDYWREDSAITYPESKIYEMLAEHEVENVATMEAGGDVDTQKTIGHLYAYEDWVSRATPLRIRQLYGHRIFLVDVGRELLTFTTAKSLVQCIADAMKAHQMAYERAGILHRDISVGNILMRLRYGDTSIPDSGFLIDWDHCVVLSLIRADPLHTHRISRTGTWQFISANLAENPGAEHTVLDDRESAFYVLVYAALRHLSHKLDAQDLSDLLGVFDSYVCMEGRPDKGGGRKKQALQPVGFADVDFQVPFLSELIEHLSAVFAARYRKVRPSRVHLFGPQDDTAQAARQAEEKLQLLQDGSWLHSTLAAVAAMFPEPERGQLDWVDNSIAKTIFPKPNKKRPGEAFNGGDYGTGDARVSKRARGMDGQASRVYTSEFGGSSPVEATCPPVL